MSYRRLLYALPAVALAVAAGLSLAQRDKSGPDPRVVGNQPGQPADLKPTVSLPISQVILFNSGVGHFTRSGEVEGDARGHLPFPERDVNDLINSMTLRNLSPNGRLEAATYESHHPTHRTLARLPTTLTNPPRPA